MRRDKSATLISVMPLPSLNATDETEWGTRHGGPAFKCREEQDV